ncbi:hypothetical protein POKO110462_12300 [Pontibacter korlensis]|uniref:Tetratricopeptide repeat protein n=1 Tax=Pontibacter korlensis TaxID=400092 RepID=A0A0E3UVF9_9BACT|nr:hypothetical protein [Pontibacter korlensis]AKD02497.1 hypothetical protein PKOR_04390 [Pontibacter korlensis]
MLKKTNLYLLGLLCILQQVVLAQEIPDYTKVYHPVINHAELRVVKGKYEEALQAYEQAFASVPSPFARDYYNAAICAVLLQDRRKTFNYLENLVEKGVSLEYLEQQPVLDSLQETRKWRRFAKKYPKRRHKFDQKLNKELRADLDELYAQDQYFRQAKGGWRVHGDTIRKIEAANTLKLLNWIEEYGYPGEDLIGVADTLEQLPRFSIVIRRQTKARKGHDFTEVLMQAVQQGRMAPQPAAYLLDQQAGQNKYGSRAYVKVNCSTCEEEELGQIGDYLVMKISEEDQQKINERREKLGLEPLDDYRRKILFSTTDDRFKLNFTWSIMHYVVPSKEAAKVLLEGLTLKE